MKTSSWIKRPEALHAVSPHTRYGPPLENSSLPRLDPLPATTSLTTQGYASWTIGAGQEACWTVKQRDLLPQQDHDSSRWQRALEWRLDMRVP